MTSVQFVPFHNSLAVVIGEALIPPVPKAAVVVPCPTSDLLPVFKLLTSVQFVPFQVSVLAVLGTLGPSPPKAKTAVLEAPQPVREFLAAFKSLTSVQLVPFHDSVNGTELIGQKLTI